MHRRPLFASAFLLVTGTLAWFLVSTPTPAAEPKRPRLAILLYFDQLRGDFLQRWQDLYEPDGFQRLMKEGAWYQNCHYPYAVTVTGTGHASVSTGANPDIHGIVGNEWYDRKSAALVNCVGSERFMRVPPPAKKDDATEEGGTSGARGKKYPGVSPERLLAPTFGDALKLATGGSGKVVSLSFKDRGAVLPAGFKPDACYWFASEGGVFVTSTYFREQLHPWVRELNEARPADRWWGQQWTRLRNDVDYDARSGKDDVVGEGKGMAQGITFPHPFDGGPKKLRGLYYEQVYTSPHGNELLLEAVKKAIEGERLGQRDAQDFLSVSFSSNDAVGHSWGPDSHEVLDTTLRTDLIIRDLLRFLDSRVGKGNYILALTADHGICPLPEVAKAQGHPAGRISATLLKAKTNDFLTKKFGGDAKTRWVEEAAAPWIYLNPTVLKQFQIKPEAAEQAVAEWLVTEPGVQSAYTRQQLQQEMSPNDAIGQMMRRAFSPDRCGDIGVVLKPYYLAYGLTGTTHGAPHPYDTHVPLLIFGAGVKPGVHTEKITPLATAAILAHGLGIKPPAKAQTQVPDGLFEGK